MAETRKHALKTKRCKTRKVRFVAGVDFSKDSRVLMLYIASRRYITPKSKLSPDAILRDAVGYLHDEHYMYGLQLRDYADCEKLPRISMQQVKDIVRKALTKKYLERPSPPFSAGPLCRYVMEGNDGKVYRSVKVGTACAWKKVNETLAYL
jgi:hypothetical protein